MTTHTTPSFRPVIVAPTFNNGRTVIAILQRITALGLPLIVVDDGCTDGSRDAIDRFRLEHPALVTAIHHDRNRGKAAALATGFEAARAAGYSHALTIDTDGQHDPEEIPQLLESARSNPRALVLGVRSAMLAGCPARCLLGRRLSNFFIRLESGAAVVDSQSGFRVYPLGLLAVARCVTGRFAMETEIIVRAAWAGAPIVQLPITSRYFPPGERVSHFRPFVDTVRCFILHTRLLLRSLIPLPHRPWIDSTPARHDASPRLTPAEQH